MKNKLQILLLFFLVNYTAFAQFDYSFRTQHAEFIDSSDSKLYFNLNNLTFIKNNEYSPNIAQGYTLPGFHVSPSLSYYFNDMVCLEAGVQYQYFFGEDTNGELLPRLSLHAKLTPHTQMILGSIKSTTEHNMIEPLYDPEYQLTRPMEQGVQFLYDSKYLTFDTWLDWEHFIRKNDTLPEEFNIGIQSKIKAWHSENIKIDIPYQLMIRHSGGEISNYPTSVQSLISQAVGISLDIPINKRLENLVMQQYFLFSNDLKEENKDGIGSYSNLLFKMKRSELMLSHFWGNDFYSIKGHVLFQNRSSIKSHKNSLRRMIAMKYAYIWDFSKGINFVPIAELYYDLQLKEPMISFSVNFSLSQQKVINKY